MPDFAGFAKGAGNLLTGGLLGQLSPDKFDPNKVNVPDIYNMDQDKLKAAASYDPGVLQRLGNLLTGGIYGNLSGMEGKQDMAAQAKDLIMRQEIERRLKERMAQQNLAPIEEPPVM
jgi:hypothetical protein